LYCHLGRLVPSELGKDYLKIILDYIIWNNSIGTFLDGLDLHRNGLIFVCDLEGVGWKNIDIALQRKVNNAMMDNFPLRIQKVLILNPPGILGAIMGCVRVFVKKKIMDRIQTLRTRDELLDHIDADQLWSEFGGECEYSVENLIEDINARMEEKPLKLHTITKNKKNKKKKAKQNLPKKKIKTHKQFMNTTNTQKIIMRRWRLKKKPKKSSRSGRKNKNVDLDGVNVEEIPQDVLNELQQGTDDPDLSDDEENTNSFVDKIEHEDSSLKNSNSNRSSRKGSKNDNASESD